MSLDASSEPEPFWAARSGKRFFLLWVGGLLVQAVAMRLIWLAFTGWGAVPTVNSRGLLLPIAIVVHAWQAWLLFRKGWRFGVWTFLPLIGLIAPENLRWLQLQGVLAPLIETPLLAGVRLRPWAWLLAGMGQVIFTSIVTVAASGVIAGPSSRIPGVSTSTVWLAVSTGAWLLGECAAAAVLAWWMPPAGRKEPAVEDQAAIL